MKLSIITPSNNLHYITDLWESIKNQTYENWEWVLYLNNNFGGDLIEEIKKHPKVKIHVDKPHKFSTNVGYLKNRAFNLGTGDVLVEVDHDDIITPDCLEEIAKAFNENPEVGFVYSNDAILGGKGIPFRQNLGWKYKKEKWENEECLVHQSWEPSAYSISQIYFAPDHVRAWKKEVYKKIGGHDETLSILDDQELLIRTYQDSKLYHINKTLYIYRVHGGNTWLERNKQIQDGTWKLFNKHMQSLAEREADLKGLRKIDIGGGLYPRKGYETVDIKNGDIEADLNKKWPFKDNEIGVINASHILEHLVDKHHSMSEIHRVLAHGGYAFIDVPSTDGRGAFQDPTHVSYWNQNSFLYYTTSQLGQFIYNKDIRFQSLDLQTYYPNQWMKDNKVLVTRAWLRCIKKKDRDRDFPGEINI
tara:strand:- start:2415 stop:3668 length:1254 start_codon:yes stop_codon:yes gene_type:complete